MPLSWNEIKTRASVFAREWQSASDERAQAQEFWLAFFDIFGVRRPRIASFEHAVKKHGGGQGFIDLFWPSTLLIEHKSRGKNLQRAHSQALDYFPGLKERDLPRYVLVSDFARMRLYDLELGNEVEFALAELPQHITRFAFIAGYQTQEIKPQDPVNAAAALKLGKLHDALKASGYDGHPLEVLLVRLLFCLFGDDTGIFQPAHAFRAWLEDRTAEDGTDLGAQLAHLFQVLNTADAKRSAKLDEQLRAFPYINGKLFAESLPLASFDSPMREQLLDCCALDWSAISPAIFGAMFQGVMDDKARRHLGAHYTSEQNILKLIKPLFLDALWAEFGKVKSNRNRLFEFHKKLRGLNFFDPACGCGNFLVITYRELRLLELEVLRAAYGNGQQQSLDIHTMLSVDVDQFHGIEIEEFPAQIAQVALWLVDHQMNVRVSAEFGAYFARIPLKATPHIVHGNALQLDWAQVLPPQRCSYVLGNPPFVGAKYMSDEQRADVMAAFHGVNNAGLLDFVAGWYVLAARYLADASPQARCAFVSTNSITQGEQVGVLWGWLLAQGVRIHFAHRTFQWSNEARGKAAVHCVIVGFGLHEVAEKTLFEYDDIRGEPHAIRATNINPYLVDAPDVLAEGRMEPLCPVPPIVNGSIPADGGNLILSAEERAALLVEHPEAGPYVRRYLGAEDFLHEQIRYCLWLVDCPPGDLRKMGLVMARVKAVKLMRENSAKAATRAKAATAALFTEDRQPRVGNYLAVPRTSSELRRVIPVGFLSHAHVAANDLQIVPGAGLFHFGVLSSAMHVAWVRTTSGRLKSDIRYSTKFTYNTFPWPEATDIQRKAIEAAAQAVLDARAQFPQSTLADLYDPLAMPPALLKAHQKLDAAVDAAYLGKAARKAFKGDADRVAFLFERYQAIVDLLPPVATPKVRRRTTAAPPSEGVDAF
ncbi:MAG: class I SAM-dependent DNA methyltransferase [Leptothrix sp. (in: b-proteobacteria)]